MNKNELVGKMEVLAQGRVYTLKVETKTWFNSQLMGGKDRREYRVSIEMFPDKELPASVRWITGAGNDWGEAYREIVLNLKRKKEKNPMYEVYEIPKSSLEAIREVA